MVLKSTINERKYSLVRLNSRFEWQKKKLGNLKTDKQRLHDLRTGSKKNKEKWTVSEQCDSPFNAPTYK